MVGGERRDLKKESFWREMVRGQSGSGMSVRAWCRRHALSEPAFYWWRRRLAGCKAENPAAALVPVRVIDDAIVEGAVATVGAATGGVVDDRVAQAAGRIEVVLANGRRVHLIGPVDRQALTDVLAVLTAEARDGEARAWACDAERGVYFGVVKRRVRGQAELPGCQKALNRAWSVLRAIVEHPFAWMRNMGYRKVRYRGLARNALDFGLLAAAYNLKRSFSLQMA